MSIELVRPSNHLIFCHPLLLRPSIFSSIRVFSNELALRIRRPKYWSFRSVLPMNIQGWFPLGLNGLISLLSKGNSRIFSSTTVRKHQFFGTQPSLWSSSHSTDLCRQSDVFLIGCKRPQGCSGPEIKVLWGHKKVAFCIPRREDSGAIKSADTSISDFEPLEPWEINFCYYSHPAWYFVMIAPATPRWEQHCPSRYHHLTWLSACGEGFPLTCNLMALLTIPPPFNLYSCSSHYSKVILWNKHHFFCLHLFWIAFLDSGGVIVTHLKLALMKPRTTHIWKSPGCGL